MEFIAKLAYAGDDGEVMMAGLADDPINTKDHVLFQRVCSPSAEDVALRHDRIHTGIGANECSAYGGIKSIELFRDHLKVEVGLETTWLLGTGPELLVRFDPNLESLAQLAEMLERIAGDLFADRR